MNDQTNSWPDDIPMMPPPGSGSRPSWPGYDPPLVQLARVQEAISYLREALKMTSDRLQVVTIRMQDVDKRVVAKEQAHIEMLKRMADMQPILDQYARWQVTKARLKTYGNIAGGLAMLYGAATGKITWEVVLPVLGKMFGAG